MDSTAGFEAADALAAEVRRGKRQVDCAELRHLVVRESRLGKLVLGRLENVGELAGLLRRLVHLGH